MTLPSFQNKERLEAKVAAVVEARLASHRLSVQSTGVTKDHEPEGERQPKVGADADDQAAAAVQDAAEDAEALFNDEC